MFCVCGASIAVEMGVVGGVVSTGTLNFGSYRTKTRTFTRHLKLLSNAQTFPRILCGLINNIYVRANEKDKNLVSHTFWVGGVSLAS